MKDLLITFKTAKLAKEKGFNLRIQKFYLHKGVKDVDLKKHPVPKLNSVDNELRYSNWNNRASRTSAPTQSLLQRWLREVHKLFINIGIFKESDEEPIVYDYAITDLNIPYDINEEEIFLKDYGIEKERDFKTYEEALEKGLQETLKLLKNVKPK
jgi:hypothetical protein